MMKNVVSGTIKLPLTGLSSRLRLAGLAIGALGIASCSAIVPLDLEPVAAANPVQVKWVSGNGTDQSDQFCQDFDLTPEQAQAYFDKAMVINNQQLHHQYDWLPCYVDGVAEQATHRCNWRIRAGGTAELQCAGEVTLYGCTDCLQVN